MNFISTTERTASALPSPANRTRSGAMVIAVASSRAWFHDAAKQALRELTQHSRRRLLSTERDKPDDPVTYPQVQQDLIDRARGYLERQAPELEFFLLPGEDPDHLAAPCTTFFQT